MTGDPNTRGGNKEISQFFTRLKELPKVYIEGDWRVEPEIPMCEDIVADEDLWNYRERFLPSLTDKKMKKVYEIKRELLSHSAVILNSNRDGSGPGADKEPPTAAATSAPGIGKDHHHIPFMSYFEYDETYPLYPEYSPMLPYIELNPSGNFSTFIRRSHLKLLPLENMFDANGNNSSVPPRYSQFQGAEEPNLFAYIKPEPRHRHQRAATDMFSHRLNLGLFRDTTAAVGGSAVGTGQRRAEVRNEGSDGVAKLVGNVHKLLSAYWHKMYGTQDKNKGACINSLRKAKSDCEAFLANPKYSRQVDSINAVLGLIDKALNAEK